LLLYKKLKIKSVADLEKAIGKGKIAPVLGLKTEERIRKGIEYKKKSEGRHLLSEALTLARRIEGELRAVSGVKHAVVAGSVRRKQETVGDLDFIVTTSSPKKVMDAFASLPDVQELIERGPTMVVVRLRNGMHADIRVVPDDSFGAALQYFTGDKEHNIVVRKMAIAKGLKLNEYGIWRGKKRLASRTEEEVYKVLGLPYMEPEIRTASGEIEAAKAGGLPKLIPYGSLRGDLQIQTAWTDGSASIEKMAEEARGLGLEYIAVTDHTKTLAMTGGLDEKKLAEQGKKIDAVNAGYERQKVDFRVLKGSEVNIMKDGKLDIDGAALAKLDLVGASVHSHFTLSRVEQTARMIAAMNNAHVDVIFHPTGRILGERDQYDIDIEAVLKEAKRTGTAMELNASPDRLDLRDAFVRRAVELGVKLVIDSDSHHPSGFASLEYGVAVARRGWATSADVLNTRKLPALLSWLKKPKSQRK
jgi:DNA polymerase (family 10)